MPHINRRHFLTMSTGSFLSLTAVLPFLSASSNLDKTSETNLSWQEFIEKIETLAGDYGKPDFDEMLYLKKIKEMAEKLDLNDKTITKFYESYKNRRKNFPEFTEMHKKVTFEITLLEFEKGEKIPLHNHPNMSGVILCSSGKVLIDNFNLLKEKSTNDKLLLKQLSSLEITPGLVGSLASDSGNIHKLEAKEFSRLIDIFTPPYDKQRIADSKFFVKESNPYENSKNIFEASHM